MAQQGSHAQTAHAPARHLLQQVELVHTTLSGLALIALILLAGLLLPVFGFNPVSSEFVAGIITVVACIGIGTLYALNWRAHLHVVDQARLTEVLINSLGQGFLSFDQRGLCGRVYSQACHTLLKTDRINGQHIADVLRISAGERKDFEEWLGILFMPDHALGFDDAARFMPDQLKQNDGRAIMLSYRPVRSDEGTLMRIVLIATDKTEEKEAQKRADNERLFAAMICAIFAERQSFALIMTEMRILLDKLGRLDAALLTPAFFRDVHTMKGAALHFKMDPLGHALHELENALGKAENAGLAAMKEALIQHRATIQLEFGRIQNALRDIFGEGEGAVQGLIEVDEESLMRFGRLLKQQNVSPDIYHAFQNTLMTVPLFSQLKSLDRQMQTLAEKLEKKIRPVVFTGDNVRFPARALQHLMLALTHVVHNIVDHGIEAPLVRVAKGKDATGRVDIAVRKVQSDDGRRWIEISMADDGAGIDPNRVRHKLLEADPHGTWREEDDRTVIQRLLTHDISTRDEVSLVSGRGAGMTALYEEVMRLGGQVELRSEMHKGTELVLRLPEALANALPE